MTARANQNTETISGLHAITESLAAGERVHAIVTTRARAHDAKVRSLLAQAQAKNIQVRYEPDAWFARLGDARHQRVAGIVDSFAYAPWQRVRELARNTPDAMLVALDHIEDPQNVGAIVRNAEGAGATAVILPDRRGALVTPAARRAAAGAAAHLPIATVPNLVRALDELKQDGCWVTGLSATKATPPYSASDLSGKRVFVIGAEGKGLHRLVSEHCDQLVTIELLGKIASLNAASATAVVLFEAVRQRQSGRLVPRPNKPQKPVNP